MGLNITLKYLKGCFSSKETNWSLVFKTIIGPDKTSWLKPLKSALRYAKVAHAFLWEND